MLGLLLPPFYDLGKEKMLLPTLPAESAADLRTKSSVQSLGPGPLIKPHIPASYIKAAWGKSEVLLPKQLPRCIFSSHLFFVPDFTRNHSFPSLGVSFDTVNNRTHFAHHMLPMGISCALLASSAC